MAIKLRNNSNHQMRQKVHTRILTFTGHRNLDPINIKNAFFTRNNNHIFKRNGRFKRSIFYWWKTCGLIIGFKVGGWKQHHQAHLAEKYIYIAMYIRQLSYSKWYPKQHNEHFLLKKHRKDILLGHDVEEW